MSGGLSTVVDVVGKMLDRDVFERAIEVKVRTEEVQISLLHKLMILRCYWLLIITVYKISHNLKGL